MAHVRVPRFAPGPDQQGPPPPAATEPSRRAVFSAALAALGTLTACATPPSPETAPTLARRPDPELGALRDGAPDLVVAGERLNPALLRRFYARHGFAPVWAAREAQADALGDAVLRAGAHGLDAELFHAGLLRRASDLSPLDRELVLSDAVLTYADALAHGAVPVERRGPGQDMSPEPVDVAVVLDAAIRSSDPGTVIEALAPATPAYDALRQALRERGSNAPGGDRAELSRRRAIEVNLERQRWLPRVIPADRVWVNVADQKLTLHRADQPVFTTRVVVGSERERDQSPEFHAMIRGSFFNPPWVVPADIVQAELLPRIQRDPDYLARNNMVLKENGEVEQGPGPSAGLGYIMIDMPNRFDVYLHDTPGRHVFVRDNRRLSHGCIRVENPREFVALLFGDSVEAIDEAIGTGVTTRRELPTAMPVFVTYQTAFVDAEGRPQFRPDFYDRDDRIWRELRRHPPAESPDPDAAGRARIGDPARGSRARTQRREAAEDRGASGPRRRRPPSALPRSPGRWSA